MSKSANITEMEKVDFSDVVDVWPEGEGRTEDDPQGFGPGGWEAGTL